MSNNKLRAGIVTSIRVNPEDCQSVLDLLEHAGMKIDGMSFAGMVSLALSSSLQTFRDQKVIPEPDPFEYLNRLQPFLGGNNKRKQAITTSLAEAGAKVKVKGVSQPRNEAPEPEGWTAVDGTVTKPAVPREATRRFTELIQKKEMCESGVPGVLWQESDEEEYQGLYKLHYPEG